MSTDPALIVFGVALLGALGLTVGSFLAVVIHRVPQGISVLRPPSSCPNCLQPIAARDNIPSLSWLILRGRCRTCGMRISVRYPLVEVLNALIWLSLGWWSLGPGGLPALLPLLLVLGSAGLTLFFIDIEHHRLPDAIVLPLYPITVTGLIVVGLATGEWPVLPMLVGVGAWLAVIGGLWFVSGGRGMGFGDVKLAPVLGATLGWVGVAAALVALFAAFALGAIVGLVLIGARRAGLKSALAFGPFLLVGALIGLFAGQPIADAYRGLLGTG